MGIKSDSQKPENLVFLLFRENQLDGYSPLLPGRIWLKQVILKPRMADLLQIRTFLVKTSFHIITFHFNCAKFIKNSLKWIQNQRGTSLLGHNSAQNGPLPLTGIFKRKTSNIAFICATELIFHFLNNLHLPLQKIITFQLQIQVSSNFSHNSSKLNIFDRHISHIKF